jgi:hypothetical protein
MARTDGVLVPMDEYLNHQITDTFASVQQSDRSWTEKVCLSVGAHDGSIQIGFGLGKYLNRNVMDAYAGVSRGVEQITVRASRMLLPSPDDYNIGPIHYEIVEPLKKVRIRLEENELQPISFDILIHCDDLPPFLETHEFRRQFGGYRIDNDLVRYHQSGVASGWISVDGKRHEVSPDKFYATRDHSWGVRYGVGDEPQDIMPGIDSNLFPMNFLWSPMRMVKPDGSVYGIHHFYLKIAVPGVPEICLGGIEHPDGQREEITHIEPALSYDPINRRLQGGSLQLTLKSGEQRTISIEVVGNTGFHLGAGLYFGLYGKHHGQWRGELHLEGDRFEDCSELETAKRIHQIRDCLIKITEGDAVGYANYQTVVNGEWPELSLSGESSFI